MEVNLKLQQCNINGNVNHRNFIVVLLYVKLKDVKFQVNSNSCNVKVRRRVGILYFSIGNTGALVFFSLQEDDRIVCWSLYVLCNV